jgi:integrase
MGSRYVKARLDEGATAGTVRREWQVLNRILNVAVRYEKLDRNPLKHVELPDAEKRTRIAEPEELSLISKMRENDPHQARMPARALAHYSGGCFGRPARRENSGDRTFVDEEARGWVLAVSPASRKPYQRNPARSAVEPHGHACLGAEIPSLADGRVFRRWTHQRAFKEYWSETCRRVGIHDLHFHDLRHTFATRFSVSVWITKSGRRSLAIACPA